MLVYLALVLSSVVLQVFVVYGRTARQLVPFLCMLAAHELYRRRLRVPRVVVALLFAAAVVQVGFNLRIPLMQVFPEDFRHQALQASSTSGSELSFIYVDHIYPVPERAAAVPGAIILTAPHPLQFLPYQYEGYTPEERDVLRTTDIRMRAIAR